MKHKLLYLLITLLSFMGSSLYAQDLYNYKNLPKLQLDFINTRYQAYFCYNMCTFKNLNEKEYAERCKGTEPVSMFAPKGLDCNQWAQVCKDAKMEGGWLITKHHGGFCIWNSAFTDYDIGSAKDKRDIVGEFVKAFRKAGLKVGLYYSILDYHHGITSGCLTQQKLDFVKNQISELLTNYGPIDYINFDGWSTWPTTINFDDIYYGDILRLVKRLQPNCLIISHTYESNLAHAEVPFADAAGRDYPYHPDYLRPCAGSDFLQCGWWWNDTGKRLKTPEYVLHKLNSYSSHNGVYILNISPNPEGRIDDDAIKVLKDVARRWVKPEPLKAPGKGWGYSYDVNKNKAFMKHAFQSSTADFIRDKRAYPRAEIAVDGVTEANSEMEQTSITKREDRPWWMVDLGESTPIKRIRIYNCTDMYKTMMKNFSVEILNTGGKVVWSSRQTKCPDNLLDLPVNNVSGEFVRIRLNERGQLAIGEVIVE